MDARARSANARTRRSPRRARWKPSRAGRGAAASVVRSVRPPTGPSPVHRSCTRGRSARGRRHLHAEPAMPDRADEERRQRVDARGQWPPRTGMGASRPPQRCPKGHRGRPGVSHGGPLPETLHPRSRPDLSARGASRSDRRNRACDGARRSRGASCESRRWPCTLPRWAGWACLDREGANR